MALQPTARNTLLSLVEEHLTQLVREAASARRHSKRRRVSADDVNMALSLRGSERLYATGTVVPPGPGEDPSTQKVDLERYLKSEMQVRPPSEVGLDQSWLAVDGKQPEIPQNPPGIVPHSRLVQPFDEQQEGKIPEGVGLNELLPRLLSEELQLYYTRLTLCIERGGDTPTSRQQQDAALVSVARDPGLQELVPFFTKFLTQQLSVALANSDTERLRSLIRLAFALLRNPHLHLELHLHQLLPTLLSCVVAKQLSSAPFDNHWALRREAAQSLVLACNLFGDEYSTLKARVLRALCEAAGAGKPPATQYGGFIAISLFGPKAVEAFLLPLAVSYWSSWEDALKQIPNQVKQQELHMCQQALLVSMRCFCVDEHLLFTDV